MKWIKYASRFHPPISCKPLQLGQSHQAFHKLLNIDFGLTDFIFIEGEVFISEENVQLMQSFFETFIQLDDVRFLQLYRDKCHQVLDSLIQLAQEISNKSISQLTNQEIGLILENFEGRYRDAGTFIPVFRAIGKRLEQILVSRLDELGISSPVTVMQSLTYPEKETEAIREHTEMLRLADYITQHSVANFEQNPIVQQMVKAHVEEFSWIGIQWYVGKLMTTSEVNSRLRYLLDSHPINDLNRSENSPANSNHILASFMDASVFGEIDLAFLSIVREYVFLRTYRADMINKSIGLIYPFLCEVGGKLGISYESLILLIPEEIIEGLHDKPIDIEIIEHRKKGFASLLVESNYSLITGEDLEAFKIRENLFDEISSSSEVKGDVACQGRAKGKAKVVRSVDDIPKVESGDVLVAVMTFPAYVPAMERAAAFVTDDGGILCHAAIIAREMQKPCIINTAVATQTFKDGDILEINAYGDQGIVRKVE